MRYVIEFYNGTVKRVSEEAGEAFKNAMKARGVVEYRGSCYAGADIRNIRTMKDWIEDERASGAKICKYGEKHEIGNRCDCRDRGLQMLPEDERCHISLPEPMREVVALPEAPPTEAEKKQMQAIREAKAKFLGTHTMPKQSFNPVDGCEKCKGTGRMPFDGHKVICFCITEQMEKAGVWS